MNSETTPKTFFDVLNNINAGSRAVDLLADTRADQTESISIESNEKLYVSFMINRGLSYFNDSVLFANEMNKYASLPVKMQYHFYLYGLPPRKRFSKWFKKLADDSTVELIKEKYGYSSEKARDVLPLFSEAAIKELKNTLHKGGTKK
jgi:hypothetical protein